MEKWGLLAACLILSATLRAAADVTPIDAPLEEDGITEITVKYDGTPVKAGGSSYRPPAGEYHYKLYVPADYSKDPKEVFPLIFVQMPGGNPDIGRLKKLSKDRRYLVALLVEAKNGPWEPILANFSAAHDDVVKRCRVAEGFKYMTGFSGGARSSTLCSELRPGFGGVLLQGASFWPGYQNQPHNPSIGVYQIMGVSDGIAKELPQFHKMITPDRGLYQKFWDGHHTPPPAEYVEAAFDWLEWWSYYGAPTHPAAKPMYLQYWKKLQAEAESASDDFAKYEAIEKTEQFATKRSLSKDKEIAAKLATMKKQLTDLSKGEAVKKELPARTAYQKIADAEYTARRRAQGDLTQHKKLLAEAATAYAGIADKHKGTIYGEKATADAERVKTESELVAKPKQ